MHLRSAAGREQEDAAVVSRNTRAGLLLFAVYAIVYVGFMLLSAFAPQQMGAPFLGGVNLAVIYGFGLIAAAIALALIYVRICRKV